VFYKTTAMTDPAPAHKPLLEVHDLVKIYRASGRSAPVRAVDGVSFAVMEGICFGLLGPNGAGKSTTIEIIEDVLPPTSGEILYRGGKRNPWFREEVGSSSRAPSFQLHSPCEKRSNSSRPCIDARSAGWMS